MSPKSSRSIIRKSALREAALALVKEKRVLRPSLVRRRLRDGSEVEYLVRWKKVNIDGKTFGRWTVIKDAPNKGSTRFLFCKCSCGTEREVHYGNLTSGASTSCGCLLRDFPSNVIHGQTGSREYVTWINMRNRCGNPNNKNYYSYGGRGIKVCDRWKNSFSSFIKDMGPCPANFEIERVNNSKGYSPDNCQWASRTDQANNTRNNVFITYGGQRKTISQWAAVLKMKTVTLYARLNAYGWSAQKAFTTPVGPSRRT